MAIMIASLLICSLLPASGGEAGSGEPEPVGLMRSNAAIVAHRLTTMSVIPAAGNAPALLVHGDRFGYLRISEFRTDGILEVARSRQLEGAILEVRVDDLRNDGSLQISTRTHDGHVYVYSNELDLLWESLHWEYDFISAFCVGNVDVDAALELIILAGDGRLDYVDGSTFIREFQSIQVYAGSDIAVGNVDNDPEPEIVLNSGFVVDTLTGESEWATGPFGPYIELLDIDGDGIDEILAYDLDQPMQIYSVDSQQEEPVR